MRITYHGPHDGVELAALTNVVVRRGQTIEVDDEFGARLVEQASWDTSPEEVLGWIGAAGDVDQARERAARMLVAEQHGEQRPELVEFLQQALKPAAAEPPPDTPDDTSADASASSADTGAADQADETDQPTDEQADGSTARSARTRKGAK